MAGVYPVVVLNGVNLATSDKRISLHPDMPPRTTSIPTLSSVQVPGRDGSLRTPVGPVASPLFTVTLVLNGVGADLDARVADVDSTVQRLGQMVSVPSCVIEYRKSASEAVYCEARVKTFAEPATVSRDVLTVTIVFELIGPYWWDTLSAATDTRTVTGTAMVYTLGTSHSGTAPIIDSQQLLTGPLVNPRVTDVFSGDWWAFAGTIPAGQKLRFDSWNLRATMGSGVTYSNDGTSVSSLISVGGSGNTMPGAFRIMPGPIAYGDPVSSWRPQIRIESTGFTSASRWEVNARKAQR